MDPDIRLMEMGTIEPMDDSTHPSSSAPFTSTSTFSIHRRHSSSRFRISTFVFAICFLLMINKSSYGYLVAVDTNEVMEKKVPVAKVMLDVCHLMISVFSISVKSET